jgi:hypothetical protein
MKYVANAFSIKMIQKPLTIKVSLLSEKRFFTEAKDAYSVIGHQQVADYLGFPCNRESITVDRGDILYVAVESGSRNNAPFEFQINPETEKFYKVEVL